MVIALMFLIVGAYLVYLIETPIQIENYNGSFRSIADAIWWALITVIQEKKRDEALSRLVPAAASVIRNWWRYKCTFHEDKYSSTWKVFKLIRRRVNDLMPANVEHQQLQRQSKSNRRYITEPGSAPPMSKRQENPFYQSSIRHKSITSVHDLPTRYVAAIKIIRLLKYSSACRKFQQAKRPIDIKDVVHEHTQINHRLSIMLNDVQRRIDLALGTTKLAGFLSNEEKRQQSLSARIEKVEMLTSHLESNLDYLEQLTRSLAQKSTT
ncbi:unnamed protein product [Didymodactylos carnosus]|uniref:Potassium channel voltage dependent KCNQ C-terminal domain-containing protein n=1 Tax=Didymodactylos carnosus TaxID=1234261 RepID=A0A813U6N3_9BILA|nr:unnamed protein product [Didymodactylos carnosus]CAF3608056.1 unnamed protein product [Didymodactylos carnosus]